MRLEGCFRLLLNYASISYSRAYLISDIYATFLDFVELPIGFDALSFKKPTIIAKITGFFSIWRINNYRKPKFLSAKTFQCR